MTVAATGNNESSSVLELIMKWYTYTQAPMQAIIQEPSQLHLSSFLKRNRKNLRSAGSFL